MPGTGFHAVVLAGGRSARLGGTPKARLSRDGRSLVRITVDAVDAAAAVVVVGPGDLDLPGGVLRTREDPPFAGPAAGIAAGLAALAPLPPVPWTMTLACDMPGVAAAVAELRAAAAAEPAADGLVAVDAAGHRQPLAALCRTPALRGAYAGVRPSGRSVFSMLRGLVLQEVAVPEEATADVDTWDDVRRHRLS
ncbi:NTP transferase domain-containing protein [Kocuria flava]|uniref:NTP transferase domain-containing protein n=1 Tax=Kocuria flava TaxID=446860 RepID=UPI001FF480D9|nr:NTP transferase domain-containing protein [Kocuria flava]MCJ8504213.1 NTP transferase domain-containing protein [Kocuria flava]